MEKRGGTMKKSRKDDRSALFIPAGIMIGIGIGFITNQIPGGLFIGLGTGFLGMALVRNLK